MMYINNTCQCGKQNEIYLSDIGGISLRKIGILYYTYESPVYKTALDVIASPCFFLRAELAYSSGRIQSWFAGLSEVLTLLTSLLPCKDINVFSSAFCSLISTILTSLVECFQLFRNFHILVKETPCSMQKIQYPSCVNLIY